MSDKLLVLSAGHYLYTPGRRCDKRLDPNETREWVLNDRIAVMVEEILNQYSGIMIIRADDRSGINGISIQERKVISDTAKADFYLAIHHNGGAKLTSGGGISVFHYPISRNKQQATSFYNSVLAMNGLRGNRSNPIQSTLTLYEVTAPKADAILLENGFMDSLHDTPIILTDEFARATAQGIASFFIGMWGLKPKTETVAEPIAPEMKDASFKVKVKHDKLNIRQNPTALSKLMGHITDHGIYTIVDVDGNWGRLKSGAGWICITEQYCTKL